MNILVLNSGSSSLKYQVIDTETGEMLVKGYYERIGQVGAFLTHKVNGENLIEISKFPALSNDGGYLALSSSEKPEKGHTFDTCCFREEMHDTDSKKTTGISLGKKSPELSSLNKNWCSSKHTTGGTPGIKNM